MEVRRGLLDRPDEGENREVEGAEAGSQQSGGDPGHPGRDQEDEGGRERPPGHQYQPYDAKNFD